MDAKTYRERNRKIVTIDDIEWTIRKIPPSALGEVMKLTGMEPATTEEAKKMAEEKIKTKLFDIAKVVIPACVLNPKVEVDTKDENKLDFDDLSFVAMTELLDVIYKFSGITPEAMKEKEQFREKPTR
jgi:hypothetical protein